VRKLGLHKCQSATTSEIVDIAKLNVHIQIQLRLFIRI